MRIHFYNVGKRKNSTWVPPESSAIVIRTGALRSPSSISSPTLSVQYNDATGNPASLNYCYIEEFNRYYFVNDWTFEEGIWVCSLECDVMASFKGEIGEKNYYIIRTSTTFNGEIADGLYPTESSPIRYINKSDSVLFPAMDNFGNGTFVVGIVGQGGVSDYFAFDYTSFVAFSKNIFSSMDWLNGGSLESLGEDIAKLVFNPSQYITSVIWFPFNILEDIIVTHKKISFGWWEVNVFAEQLGNNNSILKTTTIKAPKHPQQARGNYLNCFPYRRSKIHIQGFGTGDLNSSKIKSDTITIKVVIDIRTGVASAYVEDTDSGYLLLNTEGKVGFSLAIGDVSNDLVGAIGSAVAGVASIATGNMIGAGASLLNMGLQMTQSDVSMFSRADSTSNLRYGTYLFTDCFQIADEDNADNGRPYMRNGTPSVMGEGYYIVENGNVNIVGAYSEEISMIKKYLEGGFYYA